MIDGHPLYLIASGLHAVQPDRVGRADVNGVVEGSLVLVLDHRHISHDGEIIEREAEVGLELGKPETTGLDPVQRGVVLLDFVWAWKIVGIISATSSTLEIGGCGN